MIKEFRDEYKFLSNFWPARVEFEGLVFPSAEHAYVAAKTTDQAIREQIANGNMTAGQVKRFGRTITLRDDWDDVKIECMVEILKSKFSDPALKEMLNATWPDELIEGNTWGDEFWGVDLRTGHGKNYLGNILMGIREIPF